MCLVKCNELRLRFSLFNIEPPPQPLIFVCVCVTCLWWYDDRSSWVWEHDINGVFWVDFIKTKSPYFGKNKQYTLNTHVSIFILLQITPLNTCVSIFVIPWKYLKMWHNNIPKFGTKKYYKFQNFPNPFLSHWNPFEFQSVFFLQYDFLNYPIKNRIKPNVRRHTLHEQLCTSFRLTVYLWPKNKTHSVSKNTKIKVGILLCDMSEVLNWKIIEKRDRKWEISPSLGKKKTENHKKGRK